MGSEAKRDSLQASEAEAKLQGREPYAPKRSKTEEEALLAEKKAARKVKRAARREEKAAEAIKADGIVVGS